AVLEAAHHWIPPGLWFQRKLGRSLDVPHHKRTVQVHILDVMAVHWEGEVAGRESSQLFDQLQPFLERCRCVRFGAQAPGRFLTGEVLVLAFDGLKKKTNVLEP